MDARGWYYFSNFFQHVRKILFRIILFHWFLDWIWIELDFVLITPVTNQLQVQNSTHTHFCLQRGLQSITKIIKHSVEEGSLRLARTLYQVSFKSRHTRYGVPDNFTCTITQQVSLNLVEDIHLYTLSFKTMASPLVITWQRRPPRARVKIKVNTNGQNISTFLFFRLSEKVWKFVHI